MSDATLMILAIAGFVNVVAFLLFSIDKMLAKLHRWRISERTLLTSTVCGGALGALMAMLAVRHKTKKPRFWVVVILSLIAQVAAAWWIWMYGR